MEEGGDSDQESLSWGLCVLLEAQDAIPSSSLLAYK